MILLVLILVCNISSLIAIAPQCCSTVPDSRCKEACQEIVTSGSQKDQIEHLLKVSRSCHSDQLTFWQCVNQTLPVVHSLTVWSGRPCCDLAVNRICEQACRKGTSLRDLHGKCSKSTESNLYQCIQKQTDGEGCCSRSQEYSCRLVCQGTFLANYNRKSQRQVLRGQCQASHLIMQCVTGQVRAIQDSKPKDHLPCCYQIQDKDCRETCERALTTMTSEQEISNELEKTCGPILPQTPPWNCFLTQPRKVDRTKSIIMDNARLQCCSKANNPRCRTLCSRTFSTQWNKHYQEFDNSCQDLTSRVSRMEASMLTCITDVSEPCKLGCDGLQFCTNFNRPTSFFRSCNKESDDAAKRQFQRWVSSKKLSLPQLQIPVIDLMMCEPEMWKAIACATQIKPCGRKPSSLFICRDDCIYILNKCLNKSAIHPDQSVMHLCKILSPDESSRSCITVRQFTERSAVTSSQSTLTTPCRPNPCAADEVCWNNHRKCRHPENCPTYVCHKACSMGIISTMYCPAHSHIRIPVIYNQEKNSNCVQYQVCKCGNNKRLENCKDIPCTKQDKCHLSGLSKNHGEHFKIDCNYCICYSGELVCTKGRCPTNSPTEDPSLTGLSCDCPRHYAPVCASNGRTYPNDCLAKRCGGLSSQEITQGTCHSVDPCASNPCGNNFKCVPKRQVCLSIKAESCLQHECVPLYMDCNHHFHEPVCDTTGREYNNACILLQKQKTLSYRGHCQKHCSSSSKVCGHNGETYKSECEALADQVTVDYYGPCVAVGHFSGNTTSNECSKVKCAPVLPKECKPILPPGGCCLICAAELRVLYKPELADMVATTTSTGPVTVHKILEILSHGLEVAECDVFGFLGVDKSEVVILVKPVTPKPNMIQVQACIREAERIEYLVQTDSPLLKSYVTLSPILLAPMRAPGALSASGGFFFTPSSVLLSVLFLLTVFLRRTLTDS